VSVLQKSAGTLNKGLVMAHRAPLVVVPYQNNWLDAFISEHDVLATIFPKSAFQIEHVGSTAVPGLSAKPIIDIMVGAYSLNEVNERIEAMTGVGYEYIQQHEQVIPLRRFFAKPVVRPRHFHVHAVRVDSAFWRDHLLFRDALRNDSRLANEYAALKLQLAQQCGDDREAYTVAKGLFIESALNAARASQPQA
jgi:GrpB-like predicted nucleotidyltransferase (UPF0157 family)